MAKMTKAQAKRMLKAISAKAKKLWDHQPTNVGTMTYMPTADMIAIEKIVARCLKRLG